MTSNQFNGLKIPVKPVKYRLVVLIPELPGNTVSAWEDDMFLVFIRSSKRVENIFLAFKGMYGVISAVNHYYRCFYKSGEVGCVICRMTIAAA